MCKEKMFISAYACEPNRGSEIGIGWNWVLQLSKQFELWVLTRRSNKENIEQWRKNNSTGEDIHFVYYDTPRILRFWKKGLRGVRTYYAIWQTMTNRIVRTTMKENDIKIYHLLTYGNSLWKASRYGMKKFFVWGPTGGVDLIPREFVHYYGFKFKVREIVRTIIIKTLKINFGFAKRCWKANIILCKSESMIKVIPKKYKYKAIIFTDGAVNEKLLSVPNVRNGETVEYVTVGNLDAWRNFDVLIEAFCKAYEHNNKIRLTIVGKGNDFDRLTSLIKIRKMEDVITVTGQVPMEKYFMLLKQSDVVINPSYKEGAVTMAFDTMAMSKPFICFETGGYTRNLDENCAIILKAGNRERMIESLERAISKLESEEVRKTYANNMHKKALENTWAKKGEEVCRIISSKYSDK